MPGIKIRFIVTGKLEHLGLAAAFKQIFPDIEFLDPIHLNGFTSISCVNRMMPERIRSKGEVRISEIERLVQSLYREILIPKDRKRKPDYCILIDDLELQNWMNPISATQFFIASIDRHFQLVEEEDKVHLPDINSWRDILRVQCSLHFFSPMIESYFFAQNTSVNAIKPGLYEKIEWNRGDPENFTVTDQGFLASIKYPSFRHHPKHYLNYLTNNEYKETYHGIQALNALNMRNLVAVEAHCQFLRSLIDDVSAMASVESPPGNAHPLTALKLGTTPRRLRNM